MRIQRLLYFSVTIVYKNSTIYIQILLTFSQQAFSNSKQLAHNITNYKHLNITNFVVYDAYEPIVRYYSCNKSIFTYIMQLEQTLPDYFETSFVHFSDQHCYFYWPRSLHPNRKRIVGLGLVVCLLPDHLHLHLEWY